MSQQIAIIGAPGSGKTVFLTALVHEYGYGKNNYYFDPVNKTAGLFLTKKWKQLISGEFPPPTPPGELLKMHWHLHNKPKLGNDFFDLHAIDVAGESYREVCCDNNTETAGAKNLKKYIEESDIILILVNLKEIINDRYSDDSLENQWGASKCVKFIEKHNPSAKIAILLSQKDSYQEIIAAYNHNLQKMLKNVIPDLARTIHLHNLPVFAISAVNHTKDDENGFNVPAPDFKSEGFKEVLDWIVDVGISKRQEGCGYWLFLLVFVIISVSLWFSQFWYLGLALFIFGVFLLVVIYYT